MNDSTRVFFSVLSSIKETGALELTAIITALIYVVLATRANKWCWIFGIVSAAIYTWFNYSLTYYYDAGLSIYYMVIGFYGWYQWSAKKEKGKDELIIHFGGMKINVISILIGIIATIILGYLAKMYTPSTRPFFDASLTSFSLIATWMTTKKMIENWIYWVIIDAGYTILYFYSHKPSTALLNLIYTIIAIFGFFRWRKEMRSSA
ncbi:MAG TPA: nicotinamide riboside transporter PnuC [Bacteroidia bacterium]|jgi:nicotinamide mononucleotide transporter|nr:nicotinamide riboside transporter PnuC [Bacteroidia bacterium]